MQLIGAYLGLAVLAAGSGIAAQTNTPIDRAVVVVGCVNRAAQDGSLAGSPGVAPSSPADAPSLANSSEPTNTLLLNGATAPDATDEMRAEAKAGRLPAAESTSYVLQGLRQELETHNSHLVEVTGTLATRTEGAEPAAKNLVRRIQVARVRMIAAQCPKPEPQH